MIPKTAGLGLLVFLSACAAHRYGNSGKLLLTEKSPGLFVGHSQDGDVVIAASHYDAMNGLAVVDTDLGLPSRKDGSGAMICRREMPTGTHVPHWFCRYTEDMEHERQLTLNTLQQPVLSPSVGGATGMTVSQGNGSSGHAQQR